MPIDLPLLATRVFNTPVLVHGDKLDTILAAIGPRILSGQSLDDRTAEALRPEPRAVRGDGRYMPGGAYMADAEAGIAVLPILGTLVRRGGFLDSLSGLSSYGSLTDAITQILTSPDVRGLILEMDTPGGEAGGCFDFSTFIRTISEATGKPVWSHANEQAESAGYAIASATEEIWIARTGVVGSIGVVAAHVDMSKADEKAGLKWTYIYAGETKVDGNPHEPLSNRAKKVVQDDVDNLNTMFVDLVSDMRGIAADEIRATNAQSYRGSLAIEAGLADHIGTLDDAIEALSKRLAEGEPQAGPRVSASKVRRMAMSTENQTGTETGETQTPAGSGSTVPAPENQPNAPASEGHGGAASASAPQAPAAPQGGSDASAAIAAERKRCSDLGAIATQAGRLGVEFDLSAAIAKGVEASAARESILNAAASADAASNVTTSSARQPAGEGLSNNGGGSKLSKEGQKTAWGKALKR